MQKTYLLLLSLLFPPALWACEATDYAGLSYQVSSRVGLKVNQQQSVQLWRTPNQVLLQYPQQGYADHWLQLPDSRLKASRYFVKEQRAIEYEAGRISANNAATWQQKQTLVSPQLLKQLMLVEQQGADCALQQRYQGQIGEQQLQLIWRPNQHIVLQLQIVQNGTTTLWQLQNEHFDRQTAQQMVAQFDGYDAIDYADIGDNEQDPFIAKMIRQGFVQHGASGFYNADGTAISSTHNH